MSDRPIFVLGSNSFSGASFCKHMIQQEQPVIAVSRSTEPDSALLPYAWDKKSKKLLQFYRLDINHHLNEIEALVNKHKIDLFYNFAAQSMVGQSWLNPEHWFMTNAVSTIKLHNMLRKNSYLKRYVHVSTPEVYGSCKGSVVENKNYYPSTPYAVSRAAADMSLHTFFDSYDFPVVITRAANVFGEGQQLYRIIPRTILYVLLGKKLSLHGGGGAVRSFIHIDDVSAATQVIGEKGQNGEIYHISTNRMISIRTLVEKICTMMDVPFEQLCEMSDDRLGKDHAYLLDTNKIRNELNWQDIITLEQGIIRTIDWVKQHFKTLASLPLNYIHKQ